EGDQRLDRSPMLADGAVAVLLVPKALARIVLATDADGVDDSVRLHQTEAPAGVRTDLRQRVAVDQVTGLGPNGADHQGAGTIGIADELAEADGLGTRLASCFGRGRGRHGQNSLRLLGALPESLEGNGPGRSRGVSGRSRGWRKGAP